jgi:hypothetical protein
MTARKTAVARLKSAPVAKPTAGERLTEELSKPDDPYSMTFLIEQVAHTADHLDVLNALLRGDREAWLQVKIGAKTVEVVVNNVVIQRRQQSIALSKLLSDIVRRRAEISDEGDDDDVLAGLD